MTNTCIVCKSKLTKEAKFCPECGTPVPKPEPEPQAPVKKEIPPILNIEQVAELLGVSYCHIYTLMKKDGLPWFQLGARKRFITEEIINWARERQNVNEKE